MPGRGPRLQVGAQRKRLRGQRVDALQRGPASPGRQRAAVGAARAGRERLECGLEAGRVFGIKGPDEAGRGRLQVDQDRLARVGRRRAQRAVLYQLFVHSFNPCARRG